MSTAGFHITEDCAEVYLQNESGTEFFAARQTAP